LVNVIEVILYDFVFCNMYPEKGKLLVGIFPGQMSCTKSEALTRLP